MKGKKANITAITIAIFVILGVVAIAIAASTVDNLTATRAVSEDPFTASNSSCVDVTSSNSNCIISLTSLKNNSASAEALGLNNVSLCNYRGTYASGLKLLTPNTSGLNGQSINATYTQGSCSYVNNGLITTMMPYIVVLLAVLVFMGVAKWTGEQN